MAEFPPCRLLATAVVISLLTYFPVGYHYSVLNVAHEVFSRFVNHSYANEHNYYNNNESVSEGKASTLTALTISMWQCGAAFGSLNACWIMEKFGRKNTLMLWSNLLQILGSSTMIVSVYLTSFKMMILGRFISGFSSGLVCVSLRVFLSECSPDKYRGTVNSVAGLVMFLGVIMATTLGLPELLGTDAHFGYLVGLCTIPAMICVCLFSLFPHTPKFLYINRRNSSKAEEALKFYHGSTVDLHEVFEEFSQEDKLTQDQIGFRDAIKQKSVRLPLTLSLVAGLGYSSTGVDIFDAFSTEMFEALGMSRHDAQLSTTAFNVCGLLGAIVSVFGVDRVSRRKLLLSTMGACFTCSMLIVGLTLMHSFNWRHNFTGTASVLVLSVGTFAYGLGPSAVLESLFAEISPQKIRSVAGTVSETGFWLSNVVYVFVFPLIFRFVGCYAVLMFAVPLGLCILYMSLRLPETGRSSVYDIVQKMECTKKMYVKNATDKDLCLNTVKR